MPPCFTPLDTQKDVEKVFPHLICILWREYYTIYNLTINSGTLRLINFQVVASGQACQKLYLHLKMLQIQWLIVFYIIQCILSGYIYIIQFRVLFKI